MKRRCVLAAVVAIGAILSVVSASGAEPKAKALAVTEQPTAQTEKPIEVADLFAWATSTPPDWARGGLFFVLGLLGALVTVFTLIGGAVPGTAGQMKIDADSDRLERMSKRLEELTAATPPNAPAISAVEAAVNNLRDDLTSERWRQFAIAAVLYATLGAFFSCLLARDILQALVIGAGWTGFIGSLGLKADYAARKAAKDEVLTTAVRELKDAAGQSGTGDGGAGPISDKAFRKTLEGLHSRLASEVMAVQKL